jgi:hypothetical protein
LSTPCCEEESVSLIHSSTYGLPRTLVLSSKRELTLKTLNHQLTYAGLLVGFLNRYRNGILVGKLKNIRKSQVRSPISLLHQAAKRLLDAFCNAYLAVNGAAQAAPIKRLVLRPESTADSRASHEWLAH